MHDMYVYIYVMQLSFPLNLYCTLKEKQKCSETTPEKGLSTCTQTHFQQSIFLPTVALCLNHITADKNPFDRSKACGSQITKCSTPH